MATKAEILRSVGTFEEVIEYLTDELDWPIAADDLEDATFDYELSELGLDAERLPRVKSLRQLRPLATEQPWGVFFLEFSGPRLPLTPLRQLLTSLVTKKRARGTGSRRTWDRDDLLFIITTDSGESVELHFVAFFDSQGATPEVRSLPWRPNQSPPQHLKRLASELLPRLAWPDDTSDGASWKEQWRSAFELRHGEAISTAERLADRMADTAQQLRVQLREALASEGSDGPLHALLTEVRTQLVTDVDPESFADMCAQTLVYGTLTSRITDPTTFGASPTLTSVPLANLFLAAFFEQVYDHAASLDLSAAGLEQLVADLRVSPVEAVLDQFDSSAKGGDPVIHFYEEFLKRYDPKMRADAGAFYTPKPAVEFMVRGVDHLLRTRFGLDDGVADSSSWQIVADRCEFEIPTGIEPSAPFVSMIDPATGTGTFLVEWVRQARRSFEKNHPASGWAERLHEFVAPSMHAFELMLGPYSIAHLKVALALSDHDVAPGDVSILLTNTLDHPADAAPLALTSDPVAEEGHRAAELKRTAAFTVCIGNPPYDREQRAVGEEGIRKGGAIRFGTGSGKAPLDDVLDPLREANLGHHAKNAYNDYVYFWRWATWRTLESHRRLTKLTRDPSHAGVVAFITAASYLDGVSLGGLRDHLRRSFDELIIVDLGGDSRGARPEENIFDIRTPVAIAFGVRTGKPHAGCQISYRRISGTREEKLAELKAGNVEAGLSSIPGSALDGFTPRTSAGYHSYAMVTDLLPWIHSGSQFKRAWPIAPSRSVLKRRWEALLSQPKGHRREYLKETRDRTARSEPKPLLSSGTRLTPIDRLREGDEPEGYERYGYRSLDRHWVIADNRLADFPRPDLWEVSGPHQVFLTTLTSTQLGSGPVITATPYVPDLHQFRGSYGAKDAMPMWRNRRATRPNITGGLLDALSANLKRGITAEDFVGYVYGLTATGAFAAKFEDELAEGAGAVRVPITADGPLFARVADLGRELLWWHTFGERFGTHADLAVGEASQLIAVSGMPESARYNPTLRAIEVGGGRFGPVAPEVWQFEVSGLKVVQSWLGNRKAERKGRRSSPLDDIGPERWTFADELLTLLSIVEHTVKVTPDAAQLLDEVVAGPLIDAASLPKPTAAERTN